MDPIHLVLHDGPWAVNNTEHARNFVQFEICSNKTEGYKRCCHRNMLLLMYDYKYTSACRPTHTVTKVSLSKYMHM